MNENNNCPIFIINLKSEKNKLIKTIDEIRKINLFDNIIIKNAVTKEKAKKENFNFISYKAFNNITKNLESIDILPTWGAVGCAMSHVNCWKDILNSNIPYGIICEDDIKINDIERFKFNYFNSLNYIKRIRPTFISFNSICESSYCNENLATINGMFTGTSCYILNIEAIKKLLNIIPLTYQIDLAIGMISNTLNIDCRIFNDNSIENYNHISSTQYHFIKLNDLKNILKNNLPIEIIILIYSYLPSKTLLKKNYYYNK